jgi:hypothetical protein
MQRTIKVLLLCVFASFMTGCLTVSQYSFSLNYTTGESKRIYHDIRSKKGGDEKDYTVEDDWKELKRLIQDKDPTLDPEVVKEVSKELFQQDGVLSARKHQKVICPKCFPSKAAVLSYLHPEEWRFEMVNDEIFLFLPASNKILSTNGISVTTQMNGLIIWPSDINEFEYVVTEPQSGGESLLPFFLKEKKK